MIAAVPIITQSVRLQPMIEAVTRMHRSLLECADAARAVRQTGRFYQAARADDRAGEVLDAFALELGRGLYEFTDLVADFKLSLQDEGLAAGS